MEGLAAALQASDLAVWLKQSRWTYPAVNAAHLLGIALLVGSVVPMDLRLIGVWRGEVPIRTTLALLRPVAAFGAGLAVLTGFLLFTVQASDYVKLPLFFAKMALVAVGLAHALLTPRLASLSRGRQRLAGLISVGVWPSVLRVSGVRGTLPGRSTVEESSVPRSASPAAPVVPAAWGRTPVSASSSSQGSTDGRKTLAGTSPGNSSSASASSIPVFALA